MEFKYVAIQRVQFVIFVSKGLNTVQIRSFHKD
jgi:hypothetical protein